MEVVSLKESAESRWVADDDIVITEHEAQRRDTLQLPYTATDAECAAAEERDGLHLPHTATDAQCEVAEQRRDNLHLPHTATDVQCEAAEAAEAALSDARQAWAQKLEDLSSVLTERYQKMEMRALVLEIKANPLVDDAAIEAALTEETPKPSLVQLLVEAATAPATLLAEAATAAGK